MRIMWIYKDHVILVYEDHRCINKCVACIPDVKFIPVLFIILEKRMCMVICLEACLISMNNSCENERRENEYQ